MNFTIECNFETDENGNVLPDAIITSVIVRGPGLPDGGIAFGTPEEAFEFIRKLIEKLADDPDFQLLEEDPELPIEAADIAEALENRRWN